MNFAARLIRILCCISAIAVIFATSARAEDPASFEVGGFTFTRPTDWQWIPVSSPMRKAQLKVGGENGADVTFFHFGTQGGDVESNTKRWLAQFQSKPDVEKIETQQQGATKVTLVSTTGTFSSGMPGGPTAPMTDYSLLGAILESADGNVFVKMVGPEAAVKSAREKFLEFVATAAKSRK